MIYISSSSNRFPVIMELVKTLGYM